VTHEQTIIEFVKSNPGISRDELKKTTKNFKWISDPNRDWLLTQCELVVWKMYTRDQFGLVMVEWLWISVAEDSAPCSYTVRYNRHDEGSVLCYKHVRTHVVARYCINFHFVPYSSYVANSTDATQHRILEICYMTTFFKTCSTLLK